MFWFRFRLLLNSLNFRIICHPKDNNFDIQKIDDEAMFTTLQVNMQFRVYETTLQTCRKSDYFGTLP